MIINANKKEKVKCKICNEEYTLQMLKEHLLKKHKYELKQYLYDFYQIPINDNYTISSTIIFIKELLENKYKDNIKNVIEKLYNEYGTYKKLNNFLGFKCNEYLLYLNPKKDFSNKTRENMSIAFKNRDKNKILKEEKLNKEIENNERIKCKICNKEYHVDGIGYHLITKHNIEVKDYLFKYYNIPYSSVNWREITCKDIYFIENIIKKFPQFNNLKDLFQYLYDNNEYNYEILNKKFNYNVGKICTCLGIKLNLSLSNYHKEHISKIMTGRILDNNHKQNISFSILNMDPKKKKEMYKKISLANTGRHHTKEVILKIIKSKENQKHIYRGKAGIREDIGHYVRSTWEANYARILKYLNIDYTFEKDIYWLKKEDGSQISYIPDFKIKDLLVEVKGRWFDDAIEKFKLFKEQYPDMKIIIIDTKEYNRLKKTYKNLINNWE